MTMLKEADVFGDIEKDTTEPVSVSVVIVNWNTREMTRDCLNSLFAGVGSLATEVIVIDNASTDGSAEMIEQEFPSVILIRNDDNLGFAKANNQGIEISRGWHVLLLNTDTLVHGDVLPASVAWLEAHPDVAAMGCRVLNTDGSVQRTCSMYPSVLNQLLQTSGLWKLPYPQFLGRFQMVHWNRDSVREVEVISGCYLLVRRNIINEIGLLDEDFFFFGEETDWCKRMRDAGWRLMFAPVGEITHHGSVSARKLDYRRDVLLTQAKVRLHLKHGGRTAAAAVWMISVVFNASRAVLWSLRAMTGDIHARDRARHFRGTTRNISDAWPR